MSPAHYVRLARPLCLAFPPLCLAFPPLSRMHSRRVPASERRLRTGASRRYHSSKQTPLSLTRCAWTGYSLCYTKGLVSNVTRLDGYARPFYHSDPGYWNNHLTLQINSTTLLVILVFYYVNVAKVIA